MSATIFKVPYSRLLFTSAPNPENRARRQAKTNIAFMAPHFQSPQQFAPLRGNRFARPKIEPGQHPIA